MILKCISRKNNVDQLIRYVLADHKVLPEKEHITHSIYAAGKKLTDKQVQQLVSEKADAEMMAEFRAYKGTMRDFVAESISKNGLSEKDALLESFIIKQNVRSRSIKGYTREFEDNEKLRLHVRNNNVKAYHTVLSFSQKDSEHLNEKILRDITRQYISLRGPNSLFLGAVHSDKDHLHVHLIQSGVAYKTGLANRISRTEFNDLKIQMQEYQKEKYPQLKNSLPNFKDKNLKNKYMEHGKSKNVNARSAKDKDFLRRLLDMTYNGAKSSAGFVNYLNEHGYDVYSRKGSSKPTGLTYNGLKYRFTSLGFDKDLEDLDRTQQMEVKEEGKNKNDNERTMSKNSLLELLETTISTAKSSLDFADMLDEKGYEVYFQQGTFTPEGIVYNDTRYQFSEIGFNTNFEMFDMMKAADEIEPLIPEIEAARYLLKDTSQDNSKKEIEVLEPIEDITAGMTSDEVREYQQDLVNQNRAFEEAHGIDRDANTAVSPNQEPRSEIENLVFENLCDDCQNEKQDPEYRNPKHYTNGTFSIDKYQDHSLEELLNLYELRQGLEDNRRDIEDRDAGNDAADVEMDDGRNDTNDTDDMKRELDELDDLRNGDDNEHEIDLDEDCYCMDR